jgi:replicative DNA helicase
MSLAYDDRSQRADETPLYRQPPHNIELEQALIGCLLLNNEALVRLPDALKAEHFFAPLHRRLFEAIHAANSRNQLATPLTLKTQFEADPDFREVGGFNYLVRLVEDVPNARTIEQFGQALFDLATRRELINVGEGLINDAYDSPLDYTPAQQIEAAERALYGLAEPGKRGGGFKSFRTAAAEALRVAEFARKTRGGIPGVPTGFRKLDDKLGGLQTSDLLILAGRPGMGKTALATNMAVNAARAKLNDPEDGGTVAFFSLEMSAEQLATRIISEVAEIPLWEIRRGKVDARDFGRLIEAVTLLENLPLYIDDSPGLSIGQVAARARRMARDKKTGLDLVVIDYLQLLEGSSGKRFENRVQEVQDITKGLKNLAKELNIPVLALAQLSRGVDARDDKRPVLSDLRESGSIEQDADAVLFVFREEYYHKSREPDQSDPEWPKWFEKMNRIGGKAEVLIEKHRNGPTGTVRLAFDGNYTRFDNLADEDELPERH